METCPQISRSTEVCLHNTKRQKSFLRRDKHCRDSVCLEELFDFEDETGILDKLRTRYSQENFTNEADLKIIFADLIKHLCDYVNNNRHKPLTKEKFRKILNSKSDSKFQSLFFRCKFRCA